MSLNFDNNSNLSLVRRFHTMEELLKCVNVILTVPVFFSTNCTYILAAKFFIIFEIVLPRAQAPSATIFLSVR
jgi:hypothetical protein